MNKKEVNIDIDFADSTLKSFEWFEGSILIIKLTSWDDKIIKMKFNHVIQFSYRLNYHISDLYQIYDESDFLKEALRINYEKIPDDHPFKLFQLEDLNDFPFIQVVAKSAQVVKEL